MGVGLGPIEPALLEDWLRRRYFTARIDISSSGVENYTLGGLRAALGLHPDELDRIAFRDSPSEGCPELRAAIAQRLVPGREADIMITHGGSEAIFLAMAAVVRPGDDVVVVDPAYQSLSSLARALGARLRRWSLCPEEDFVPQVARLRRLCTVRTRMVVVNFPHNPTGATLDPEGYAELIALMADHPGYLLWDGSMAELAYDRPPLPDAATALDRCISIGSLSKAYGLPGLRVGWCVAPEHLRAAMVRLRDYVSISTSPLTEYLATAVMRNADLIADPRLKLAATNRQILLSWVARHRAVVSCPTPHGGVTAFPRLTGMADTTPLCLRLADDRGVLVIPGSCFGHPDRIRIGFGGPTDELTAGLAELASAAQVQLDLQRGSGRG